MADIDDIDSLKRSLRISKAVGAGRIITDPLEAKLLAASRRVADEEAMDLEAHLLRILDRTPRTLGDIMRQLEARFLELAMARIETRAEAGAASGTAFARSADRATVRIVLDRMVAEGGAWTVGWLRRRWGRFPIEGLNLPKPPRVAGH